MCGDTVSPDVWILLGQLIQIESKLFTGAKKKVWATRKCHDTESAHMELIFLLLGFSFDSVCE